MAPKRFVDHESVAGEATDVLGHRFNGGAMATWLKKLQGHEASQAVAVKRSLDGSSFQTISRRRKRFRKHYHECDWSDRNRNIPTKCVLPTVFSASV